MRGFMRRNKGSPGCPRVRPRALPRAYRFWFQPKALRSVRSPGVKPGYGVRCIRLLRYISAHAFDIIPFHDLYTLRTGAFTFGENQYSHFRTRIKSRSCKRFVRFERIVWHGIESSARLDLTRVNGSSFRTNHLALDRVVLTTRSEWVATRLIRTTRKASSRTES